MSRWFGESWDAPVCDLATHAATPVGETCPDCGGGIFEGHQGLLIPWAEDGVERAYHLKCFLRDVLGPGR